MSGDGHVGALLVVEKVVHLLLKSKSLSGGRLLIRRVPELVRIGKRLVSELPSGVVGLEDGSGRALVAGVETDGFSLERCAQEPGRKSEETKSIPTRLASLILGAQLT